MKTDCELIFTTSDEIDGIGDGESSPMNPSPSAPIVDLTVNPTSSPSISPVISTAAPTHVPSTGSPVTEFPTTIPSGLPTTVKTMDPTGTIMPNSTEVGSDPAQAGKNINPITSVYGESTTSLSFVNFKHENGALGKCEGDCNKDDDCGDGLLCFRRAENGGWREMQVPGCKANEDHPMRRVDYCYDPLDSVKSIIGRGEPDVDEDEIIEDTTENMMDDVDQQENVEPASPESTNPSASPVTGEPATFEPSGAPTLSLATYAPSTSKPSGEPTLSPIDTPSTAAPSLIPTSSPVIDARSTKPTTLPSITPTPMPQAAGPGSPTASPRKRPTSEFIDNTEPDEPDAGYFNYDNLSQYGPHKWNKVKPQKTDEYAYWKEFKDAIKEDLDKNYCGSSAQQSPINLFDTGSVCLEYHQIRDRVSGIL